MHVRPPPAYCDRRCRWRRAQVRPPGPRSRADARRLAGMKSLWQRPAPRRNSCKHPVYEPLWCCTLPVKALAVEPEAAALRILDEVVVACAFGRVAPPFGSDALRTLGLGYLMQHPTPAEMPRRSVGHDCQHVSWLGTLQQKQRTGSCYRLCPGLFWPEPRMRGGHMGRPGNFPLPLTRPTP